MVLALHPVYEVRHEPPAQGLEATEPLTEFRRIPDWAGVAAIGAGALILLLDRRWR